MTPDFLIVGAQKSGTTSIFKTLSCCKEIYMPKEKEVQFFNLDKNYVKGLDFYSSFFHEDNKKLIIGEASPQYLASKKASERIGKVCPDTKLIVSLRDPVERAYSHYRMTYRRGRTTGAFDKIINELFVKPVGSKEEPDINHDFLVMGEYGKQLSWYKHFFDKGLLKVIFFDDLKRNPSETLGEIFNFLGVEPSESNVNFFHENKGGEPKFNLIRQIIYKNKIIKYISRCTIPSSKRRSILFWLENYFFVKPTSPQELDSNLKSEIRSYFHDDTVLLEKILNKKVPWAVNGKY